MTRQWQIQPLQPLQVQQVRQVRQTCLIHQDDVEHFLASFLSEEKPEVVGNDYLVIGTLDRPAWKRGTQQQLSLQEMLDELHDFKEVVTFKLEWSLSK